MVASDATGSAPYATDPDDRAQSEHVAMRAMSLTQDVPGFLPGNEASALVRAALRLPHRPFGVEIGSYCGTSTTFLGLAFLELSGTLVTVDHHRGSEEHQVGWEYHDPSLADENGVLDTAPVLRRTLRNARLEDTVVTLIAPSLTAASIVQRDLDFLFLDGSHTFENAFADYDAWAPKVKVGGRLLIHDVFESPADGGQAPHEVMKRAMKDGGFRLVGATGSLHELVREYHPADSGPGGSHDA